MLFFHEHFFLLKASGGKVLLSAETASKGCDGNDFVTGALEISL
jgi:hypothetical protein